MKLALLAGQATRRTNCTSGLPKKDLGWWICDKCLGECKEFLPLCGMESRSRGVTCGINLTGHGRNPLGFDRFPIIVLIMITGQ